MTGGTAVVASAYPAGHPVAGVPAGPRGPYLATNACCAVALGTLIKTAALALAA